MEYNDCGNNGYSKRKYWSDKMTNDIESVKLVLDGIRTDVARLSLGQKASSEWSAHANWKSSSAALPGDYSISTSLVRPHDSAAKLEELADEARHERLVRVTQSLSEILGKR